MVLANGSVTLDVTLGAGFISHFSHPQLRAKNFAFVRNKSISVRWGQRGKLLLPRQLRRQWVSQLVHLFPIAFELLRKCEKRIVEAETNYAADGGVIKAQSR